MRRYFCYLVAIAILVFSLAGCSQAVVPSDKSSDRAQVEESEPLVSEEVTAQEPDVESPAASVPENADIAAIVPLTDTTPENPAAVGEWVETKAYSPVDKQYHTVYFRITDIIRNSESDEVQTAIDQYNAEDHVVVFDPLESDDLEYCLLKYEVAYPSDFPEREFGISTPSIEFTTASPDGGGIEYNGMAYIGLSIVHNIGVEPEDFHSGEIFTGGQAVFAMVNGPADYIIKSTYYENDTEFLSCVKGE